MIESHAISTTYPKGDKTLKAQAVAKHVITVDGNDVFKKAFWKTFRIIASDPVGRVLLYGLMIEIRRKFSSIFVYNFFIDQESSVIESHTGAIEGSEEIDIAFGLNSIGIRNNCRSILIKEADSCAFCSKGEIEFNSSNDKETSVLEINVDKIQTKRIKRTADIGLFHEMLHWLHYLRNPTRYSQDNKNTSAEYVYLTRSFYGCNFDELFLWGCKLDSEEIRTILGTPNYGDDEELALYRYQRQFFQPMLQKVLL
jgi:hypothetical protein